MVWDSRRVSMPNVAILVATLLVLLAPASGRAAFHLANVSEVMSGANGDPAVQFVEIRMNQPFQTVTSHSRLTAFSCNGSSFSVLLEVPINVPTSDAGLHWIMATTSFSASAGMTPVFTWVPGTR